MYVSLAYASYSRQLTLIQTVIQKEHRDPKRSFTDTAWHFRRVSDVPSLSSSPRSATRAACHKQDNTHLPQVPTVRATLPGEEHLRIQTREYNQRHNTSRSDHDKISVLFQHVSTQSHDDKVKLVPRRFHLTKDSISYSRQVQASKGGILKHRKGVPETLPIFSERTKEFLSGILLDKESSSQGREEPQEAPKPLLRRPNASATEKKWRDQNWKKPFQQPAAAEVPVKLQAKEEFLAIQRDYETLKLAAELQKFALEQTEGDVILEQHVRCAKLRSKQPPNSQAHDQSHDSLPDDHATNGNQEDESDWIVETYVRKANPVPADDANMKITDPQKERVDFGLLVIPEEDEPAWEIFADEEPGDSDEGSESSDSNGHHTYLPGISSANMS